jgi:branched-chain amino acid transport system substrate-binding protein
MLENNWNSATKRGIFRLAVAVAFVSAAGQALAQNALPARIKIGGLAGLSGPGAGAAFSSATGIRLAVKEINDAGGILGRPVDLILGDDQSDAAQAVNEARRLTSVEKVNVVFGPAYTQTALAVAPILTGAKTLSIGTPASSAYNASIAPYGFSTYFSTTSYSKAMVDYAADVLKAKKVALISDNGGQSKDAAASIQRLAAERGLTVVGVQQHEFNATDVTPQLLSLKRGEPDALLQVSSLGEDGGLIFKTVREMNWNIHIISSSAGQAMAQVLKAGGPNIFASGTIAAATLKAFTYCPGDKEGSSMLPQFAARLKAYLGKDADKVSATSANLAYDAGIIFKAAVEATKSLDGPTLAAWIEKNAHNIVGVSGRFSNPQNGARQLIGPDGLAFAIRPDVVRSDGLTQRAGC